jgi:hypothetical protein
MPLPWHRLSNARILQMTKEQPRPDRPLPFKWELAPDIPTYDLLKDYRLNEAWGMQESVDDFIYKMERDDFLTWEAVVAQEQGVPLTGKQEVALGELLSFNNEGENERAL